uniref:Photosystem I reaction centre subunit III n=2 Tax=unclassified Caudoviricetes TaxID=2788787 RepID=A0A8S5UMX9_9CAUD|nr:MAG TPA: Photosystem I reaction centre subunit III [Siphoviridae sp. ctsus30]DAF95840.1 MAG TPA: Photosystem I reaction centre subunit III [Siphoviridae sp. ctKGQ3]
MVLGWLGWVGRWVGECETLFKGSRSVSEGLLGC